MKIPKALLVISISVLFFNGCTSFKPALYERSLTGLDFSKYSKDGFLVTTGDFHKDYKSLSILRVSCYDGYLKKAAPGSKETDIWKEDDLYGELPKSYNKRDYEYKSCKLSELLDYMVEQGVRIGANGIIKLEITPVKQNSPVNGQVQNGILITGLAISYQ
jgi:hypothetical protein